MASGDTEARPSLGRRQEHDDRSWEFQAARAAAPKSVMWERRVPVWDQGALGACVGFAFVGMLCTDPFFREYLKPKNARGLYSAATRLDSFPGEWPDDDTGTSALAAAKAARRLGWIRGYQHAFGLAHALAALAVAPVVTGIPWYDSMFTPDRWGRLRVTANAEPVGGHEVLIVGCDVAKGIVRVCNSWGPGWGDGGYAWMTFDVWDRLLHEGGDVTTVTR